jgi:hypothetical protein
VGLAGLTARRAAARLARIARSLVHLPSRISPPFQVFLNGVPQVEGRDYTVEGSTLVFERDLRTDKIGFWRWALGAWGVGTYRQDDSVDVRYEHDGRARVAEKLPLRLVEEDED